MSKTKFQVGDVVVVVKGSNYPEVQIGDTGIVTEVQTYSRAEYKVTFKAGGCGWFKSYHLGKLTDEREQNTLYTSSDPNKRAVIITLEKACDWYKAGGELKKAALQAFTEQEIRGVLRPKTWNEYCKQTIQKGYYIAEDSNIVEVDNEYLMDRYTDKNLIPTKEMAEAFLAYMQLMSLRAAWIGDWEPDWNNFDEDKWCVVNHANAPIVDIFGNTSKPLSFPTKAMADEFKTCFKSLLNKAKGLY